eukprot:71957_1
MADTILQKVKEIDNEELSYKFDEICGVIDDPKLLLQAYLSTNPSLSTLQTTKIMEILKRKEFIDIPKAITTYLFTYLSVRETMKLSRTSKYVHAVCCITKPSSVSLSDMVHIQHIPSIIGRLVKIHRFYFDLHVKAIHDHDLDLTFTNKLFATHLPCLTHILSPPFMDNDISSICWWNEQDLNIKFNMNQYPNLSVFDCMIHWDYPSLPPQLHTLSANTMQCSCLSLMNQVTCARLNRGFHDDDVALEFNDEGSIDMQRTFCLDINDKSKDGDNNNHNTMLRCLMDVSGDELNEQNESGVLNTIFLMNNCNSLSSIHISNAFLLTLAENDTMSITSITLPHLKNICLSFDYVYDIGDYLNAPNVTTMTYREDPEQWFDLVETLEKLQITKLRLLRLKFWSWEHIKTILVDQYDRLQHCVDHPFCIHLTKVDGIYGRNDATKRTTLRALHSNGSLNKTIVIQHDNNRLFWDRVPNAIELSDEAWDLDEDQHEIECNVCSMT